MWWLSSLPQDHVTYSDSLSASPWVKGICAAGREQPRRSCHAPGAMVQSKLPQTETVMQPSNTKERHHHSWPNAQMHCAMEQGGDKPSLCKGEVTQRFRHPLPGKDAQEGTRQFSPNSGSEGRKNAAVLDKSHPALPCQFVNIEPGGLLGSSCRMGADESQRTLGYSSP